jgi:hypothetical protein
MNSDRKSAHKAEYLRYSIDDLELLTEQIMTNPSAYTSEAVAAWKEALAERKLNAHALLRSLRTSQLNDDESARRRQQLRDTRSKTLTRRVGRTIGFISIPLSIGVGGMSLLQSQFGGLVAAIAWLGCSFWLAFYYKGD